MLAAIKNQLPIQCRGSYFSRSFIQFSLNCSVENMRSLSLAKLSTGESVDRPGGSSSSESSRAATSSFPGASATLGNQGTSHQGGTT